MEGNETGERRTELIELLLKFRPEVQVQVTRIAELLEIDRKIVVELLEEMQRFNSLPGEFLTLEQVFIRSSKPFILCRFCGSPTLSYPCKSCGGGVACGVCKLPLKEGDAVLACPHCDVPGHRTHLLEWVKTNGSCPQCRERITSFASGKETQESPYDRLNTSVVEEVDLGQRGPGSLYLSDLEIIRQLEEEIGEKPEYELDGSRVIALNFSMCELTYLPEWIGNLTNLKELYVSDNRLEKLPDLSTLTNLQTLNLEENQLTELPDLSNLTNLQDLFVGEKPLNEKGRKQLEALKKKGVRIMQKYSSPFEKVTRYRPFPF